jgi:hypothetical protein
MTAARLVPELSGHDGKATEAVVLSYQLPEPVEHTPPALWSRGRVTTWRYTEVKVTFRRESVGGPGTPWGEWRTRVSGTAHNVLKSGEVGVLTPPDHDNQLTYTDHRERTTEPQEWCREWLQPILDDAVERRMAQAWPAW